MRLFYALTDAVVGDDHVFLSIDYQVRPENGVTCRHVRRLKRALQLVSYAASFVPLIKRLYMPLFGRRTSLLNAPRLSNADDHLQKWAYARNLRLPSNLMLKFSCGRLYGGVEVRTKLRGLAAVELVW